jgi:hypothetical protein
MSSGKAASQERAETAERLLAEARARIRWHERRADLLQKVQRTMREPERTLVCDILANGSLLPDPSGKRYGWDVAALAVSPPAEGGEGNP